MMLCAIRGNARRKTNNYHFNTEDRKIIWLENTHWHMLSSIPVALTQKQIPHETVVKESSSNGKNIFKLQLFHSVTSWHSLSLLVQIFVSCISSCYIHPVDGTHILMAQCLEINTIKSYCFCSLNMNGNRTVLSVDPKIQLQRGNIPRWQTMVFCFLSWLSQGRQSGASFELSSSETVKIKFSVGLLKCIICCEEMPFLVFHSPPKNCKCHLKSNQHLFSVSEKIILCSSPHWSLQYSNSLYVNIMCAYIILESYTFQSSLHCFGFIFQQLALPSWTDGMSSSN